MSRVAEHLGQAREYEEQNWCVYEMGAPDARRLLAAAWHIQLADAAIDEGNVMLAKDHIKSAIAAVREFNGE